MNREQVVAALGKIAGTSRLLIYDVSEPDAPNRSDATSPFVRGSKAWWSFVERRRALDDGSDLNLLVSLRGLRMEERMLMVNWGSAFANAFLIVEPSDPWLDLTTQGGIDEFAGRHQTRDPESLVRTAYAEWIYWTPDRDGRLESQAATLDLHNPDATLWGSVWERLPHTFTPADFLSSMTLMTLHEAELFTGGREVARAIVPFLTRLGLPILYDARYVIDAVRQLVDAGLAWVQDPQDNHIYRGPNEPLPPDITAERLAMMLR